MSPFLSPAYLLSILVAVTVHEWAHAFIATKLGDPTPEREGRLTLHPLAHLDPIGALMFVIIGFGWAKPVPVNPGYFRHPKRDTALTAIAGPASNLLLATIAVVLLNILGAAGTSDSAFGLLMMRAPSPVLNFAVQILASSLYLNLALMAFNLIPIAPLDGSKVLQLFIPLSLEDRYEELLRIGPFILLGLIVLESFLPIPLISWWVHGVMEWVLKCMGMVF